MRNVLFTLAIALSIPSAAIAAPTCTGETAVKPLWEIAKAFEDKGGKIRVAKETKGGCYEIYGIESDGKKVEIYIDPRSGNVLERHEA